MRPGRYAQIDAAAQTSEMTDSALLAAAARKEFLIGEGLEGVAAFELEHGSPFTEAELTEANAWADGVVRRSRHGGVSGRPCRSA